MMAAARRDAPSKTRAAGVSIASNAVLISLKALAALVTGSVAILSDAVQSSIDFVASVITFLSVRRADEPADANHRYGHEKIEDLSAGIEALLLLLGAAVIAFQALRRLIAGGHVAEVGIGVVVIGLAAAANMVVSTYLARVARSTGSPALEADGAHLRTDALVSFGVLGSLVAVKLTGAQWIDPVVGLLVAATITITGVRILVGSGRRLVDETLPDDELSALREVVEGFLGDDVVGYHDLRARHAGSHHQVDLHLQFADGTSLEDAHRVSHRLQDAIEARLPHSTVLVHLEPEDRVRSDRFADVDAPTGPAQPS
jgi:cation diffusion facilitator family transporter